MMKISSRLEQSAEHFWWIDSCWNMNKYDSCNNSKMHTKKSNWIVLSDLSMDYNLYLRHGRRWWITIIEKWSNWTSHLNIYHWNNVSRWHLSIEELLCIKCRSITAIYLKVNPIKWTPTNTSPYIFHFTFLHFTRWKWRKM